MKDKISNANFPMDAEGRTYHVATKAGETANRIITVGDPARLRRIATFLDPVPIPFEHSSHRGYLTISGRYKGTPVSLVAIGMGVAMVDFFVREVRATTEGDLAIIRFGSCGSLDPTLKVGSIGVPSKALTISTNYDYWHSESSESVEPYRLSKPIAADAELQKTLIDSLSKSVASNECEVRELALHASADCFYSSQGRIDENFRDDNHDLIEKLLERNPECASLEMETAHLLHLASISSSSSIRAAACHMIFAGRTSSAVQGDFIDPAVVAQLEPKVGRACLDAIVAWELDKEKLHPEAGSVWALSN